MSIKAKVIQDSISFGVYRLVTIECEYPRFIHSELMTHRMFSRNSASSRAIPINKMIKQVRDAPACPIFWGSNKVGMQAGDEVNVKIAKFLWSSAALLAVISAKSLQKLGLHKQIVNRVLEPFQTMKTIISATEWDNFFALRLHKDAQPEIQELARCIKKAIDESRSLAIRTGEWHVPYVTRVSFLGSLSYYIESKEITLEDAKKVSASCCAQVSYRLLDDSLDKAIMIYDKLVTSKPMHASPFEHQAMPEADVQYSNNFEGYIQNRNLIEEGII